MVNQGGTANPGCLLPAFTVTDLSASNDRRKDLKERSMRIQRRLRGEFMLRKQMRGHFAQIPNQPAPRKYL